MRQKNQISVVLGLAILAIFAGCGGKDGKASSPDAQKAPQAGAGTTSCQGANCDPLKSPTPGPADAHTALIAGTWVSDCTTVGGGNKGMQMLVVEGDQIQHQIVFTADDCKTQLLTQTTTYTGAKDDGTGSEQQFDLYAKVFHTVMVPQTKEVADYFNENSFCGLQTWANNQAISVDGKTCFEKVASPGESKLLTVYYGPTQIEARPFGYGEAYLKFNKKQ